MRFCRYCWIPQMARTWLCSWPSSVKERAFSLYRYVSTFKLVTLKSQGQHSPIPIRFFLRGYRHVSAPVEFLRDQLGLIGLGMEEWAELRRRNILVILDGLDEMSVRQDPATTRSNLDKIGSLLEELDGLPVLVTSRPHFFSSGPDRERFYDRLRRPHVFRMGQPDRRDTVAHLRAYAESLDLAPKLNKIKELL